MFYSYNLRLHIPLLVFMIGMNLKKPTVPALSLLCKL